jgi:hypothetical protein
VWIVRAVSIESSYPPVPRRTLGARGPTVSAALQIGSTVITRFIEESILPAEIEKIAPPFESERYPVEQMAFLDSERPVKSPS